MRIASCPHCGKREPVLIGMTVKCPRCGNTTQLQAASDFLKKAEALWPGVEVTLRSGRAARRIKEHDEFLKKRGDYDIITATLDENWTNDDNELVDGDSEI
jgi:hypothetical protein